MTPAPSDPIASITASIEHELGVVVQGTRAVAGGDLNRALRVDTSGGPLFVKTRAEAAPGEFAAEAAGLRWLGEADGGLAVPRVVLAHDPREDAGRPVEARFLALEWIEPGASTAATEEALGRGLAATHAAGAEAFGATPAAAPSRFAHVVLPNEPRATFAEFFADCRLRPLAALAVQAGVFSAADAALVERVAARVPELAGPPEPPARTHGDLWAGNVLTDGSGVPHLIDPAAHGGHREVDLATLRMFGGPSERCFDAYAEVHPLADGWRGRIGLWQLEIVLLHVVLFGGGYAAQARDLVDRYI